MTSGAELPRIPKSELLGRLPEGHAARTSVLTSNLRLAAALGRDFDAHQIARGLAAWEAADVLPLAAFVERLYENAMYSELASRLPILLTGAQEQALWEDIVRGSEAGRALLSGPSAAALARECGARAGLPSLYSAIRHASMARATSGIRSSAAIAHRPSCIWPIPAHTYGGLRRFVATIENRIWVVRAAWCCRMSETCAVLDEGDKSMTCEMGSLGKDIAQGVAEALGLEVSTTSSSITWPASCARARVTWSACSTTWRAPSRA